MRPRLGRARGAQGGPPLQPVPNMAQPPGIGRRPALRQRLLLAAASLPLHLSALAQEEAVPVVPSAEASAPAAGAVAPASGASAPGTARPTLQLQQVIVPGRRVYEIGPLPGLAVTKDQIPANVQSGSAEQIRASRALNLADFMNSQLQGVSVNDYSGNPFQMSVNYRGFTASPEIGTPQGLSVFFDGVRVNEPFGDVVNWDLIPVNAIDRFDLFPGSNPVFGLNTLGGALSVRSKSGFTAPGLEVSVLGGSWQRRQLLVSGGANNGELAGFGALSLFKEGGWRDDSNSRVVQAYGRGDWATDRATITASVLGANNDLIGNGLIPLELYQQRPESVFTSPDQTRNRLLQGTLSAAFEVNETMNITSRAYWRQSKRSGYNGDIYEDFQDFGRRDIVQPWRRVDPALPICQYGPGGPVSGQLLNGPFGVGCNYVTYEPTPYEGQLRNGGNFDNGIQQPGVVDGGTPIGLINKAELNQVTDGIGAQFNWNLDRHKAMVGVSIDRSRADYVQKQRLAMIDASRHVYPDPDNIAPQFGAAFADVTANQFDGKQRTDSLYASDVWSPRDNLHISVAGRYNRTRTQSNIGARARFFSDLDDVAASLPSYINCPTNDPASCPSEPQVSFDPQQSALPAHEERFKFSSFNPSIGFNWLPTPETNLFANLSRGARVPSVIELGCALDLTPTDVVAGDPSFGQAPRSLLGPACTLPTTLSGDPFLPQIRSTSGEVGIRGVLARGWQWNLSFYQTHLQDDIYLVGAGPSRTYFDTIDRTRRRGFELGVQGASGPFDANASYSYVDATFESTFYMLSPNNSSADFDQNSRTYWNDPSFFDEGRFTLLPTEGANANRGLGTFRNIKVEPGSRMPGVPAHNLNASIGWRFTPALRFGLTMVARSRTFVRGNENNQHTPGGTDQQIGQYYCGSGGGPQDCLGEGGYSQMPVPLGRPFTHGGKVPGYAIFNLDGTYRVNEAFEVNLRITNLFNRRYYTAGRLGVNPFAPSTVGATGPSGWNYNSSEWVNTNFVGPGAPRGLFLTLSYRLK